MSSKDYACERCFQDQRLLEWVRKEGSIANCNWCGAKKVKVLPLHILGEAFREVVSIYVEANGPYEFGESIEFLLQEDWEIFSERISEALDDRLRDLTLAILEAGVDPKDVDLPDYSGDFHSPSSWLEEDWERKVEALFNRADTEKITDNSTGSDIFAPPVEVLKIAFEDLTKSHSKEKIFYRARIHKDRLRTDRFELSELGAPQPEKTPAGRGNCEGKPVLYLSSDQMTAIAEVRAWRYASVAVAKIKLRKPVQIVNLLKYELPDSPFFEEHLEWRLQLSALFHRLAEELSRPVMPHERDILFKPSQHLCELLKTNGYDGVAYHSGLARGSNFILFNPLKALVVDKTYIRITEIRHKFEKIERGTPLYDETRYDHIMRQEDT